MYIKSTHNQQIPILVAKDDLCNVEQIVETLTFANQKYDVLVAPDGKLLYELAQRHLPQIILTDWEMPHMNGIDAIRKLKKTPATQHTPIIMITGIMTSSEDLQIALQVGAVDFLSKPIHETELLARVHSALQITHQIQQIKLQKETIENSLNYYHLQLLTKNNILQKITEILQKLDKLNPEQQVFIQQAQRLIQENLSADQDWQTFQRIFQAIHPHFFKKLSENYPQLSSKERNLCALLVLDLETFEITEILSISASSVRTAMYRISKKM